MTGVRVWRGEIAVSVLLIACWPVTAAATALTLTGFSPTSGPAGTVVTLTGTGFTSGDTFALFNGVPSAPSHVAANGTSMKVAVPAFATSGPVTVQSLSSGASAGLPGTVFQITAGLQLSTSHVYPGGTFTLAGTGFTAGQRDTIEIGSARVGTALIGPGGDFQIGVGVPWDATSGHTSVLVLDPNIGSVIASLFVLGDWEQARHDAAGTGHDTFETALSTSTVSGLKQKWAVSAPISGLTAADGMVFEGYATTSSGLNIFVPGVLAARATDGSAAWNDPAPSIIDQFRQTPVVANGVVYTVDIFGPLNALDLKTGTELWSIFTGFSPGQPTVANGTIYLIVGGQLSAFDASTGASLWTVGSSLSSQPAVSPTGTVVVGGSDGNLHAFNGSTGAPIWTKPGGGDSTPAIVGNVVYMGSSDGTVYARHVTNGSIVWSVPTGGAVLAPAVSGGVVYAPSLGGSLFAIQASTGATTWSLPINPTSAPAVANGLVFIDESDGTLHALNAANGNSLWSATPGDGAISGPIVSNGQVFVTCAANGTNGCLIAYGL